MSEFVEYATLIISSISLGFTVYNTYKTYHKPVLLKKEYPINVTDDSGRIINSRIYSKNVPDRPLEFHSGKAKNDAVLTVDFRKISSSNVKNPDDVFAGIAIRSLPFCDWQSFVQKGYVLQFQYRYEGKINRFHIEFSNESTSDKSYEAMINPEAKEQTYQLDLKQFQNQCSKWDSISEMCFTFFPVVDELCGKTGKVFISNMVLKKKSPVG